MSSIDLAVLSPMASAVMVDESKDNNAKDNNAKDNNAKDNKKMMPDGIGFVELLDVFGDDLTVVNAARVSFDKESIVMSLADEKLIRYLANHEHISPFFHPQLRFRIKMPLFVLREYFRHQIGLSRNEVSRRYVDSPPECWVPSPSDLRERDSRVKQGSKDTPIEDAQHVWELFSEQTKKAIETYQYLLSKGVAPEVARAILPQSMYSEFIETGSLAAYARICHLRLDPHAQKEIRDYATILSSLLQKAFPVSWAALQKSF